jgi:hypothetical protein
MGKKQDRTMNSNAIPTSFSRFKLLDKEIIFM